MAASPVGGCRSGRGRVRAGCGEGRRGEGCAGGWCGQHSAPGRRSLRPGSGAVDVHAGRLHAGGRLHADLQTQLLDRLPGQEGDEPVRACLDLDLGRDIAELHGGDDAREGVARRGVRGLLLARGALADLDREGGQRTAVDQPAAGLVAMGRDPAGVRPASGGVGADSEKSCCLTDCVGLHARHARPIRLAFTILRTIAHRRCELLGESYGALAGCPQAVPGPRSGRQPRRRHLALGRRHVDHGERGALRVGDGREPAEGAVHRAELQLRAPPGRLRHRRVAVRDGEVHHHEGAHLGREVVAHRHPAEHRLALDVVHPEVHRRVFELPDRVREHGGEEGVRRLRVAGEDLAPAVAAGCAHLRLEPVVGVGLPDAEDRAAGVAGQHHRAERADLHGLHEHLAAGRADLLAGGGGVRRGQIQAPRGRAVLVARHRRDHGGRPLAVRVRRRVVAELRRTLAERPAEHIAVEALRALQVGERGVRPTRGAFGLYSHGTGPLPVLVTPRHSARESSTSHASQPPPGPRAGETGAATTRRCGADGAVRCRRDGPAPRTREELLTRLDDVLADEWPAAEARLTARLAAG
ncbi:protein of unknown function [Streptomyces sp. KY75]|nr:protein of unknown function [Streptomyces sp. KY75]